MQKSRKLASGKWQARYIDAHGKRQSAGTFEKKSDADRAAAKADVEVQDGTRADPEAGNILFADYAAKILQRRAGVLAPRSVLNFESNLRLHINPTFGHVKLRDIRPGLVKDWWSGMPSAPMRKNAYFTLSSVLREAEEDEEIKVSPAKVSGAGRDLSKPRQYLRPQDVEAIIRMCDPDMSALLTVVFGGALRISEALGLDKKHVNLMTGVIEVSQQVSYVEGGTVIREQTKNGENRTTQLTAKELAMLNDYVKRHPMFGFGSPVFRNHEGKRLSKSYVYRAWGKARSDAGLPWAHIHDLRHTSLTVLHQDGGTLADVMAVAGHKDLRSAMRYQHSDPERLANIIAMRDKRATSA